MIVDASSSRNDEILHYLVKYFRAAVFVVIIWIIGYFQFSVSWILLGLFFYMLNDEVNETLKRTFVVRSAEDEKAAILSRTDDLPSWVFFPDVERAEWLNKILKQMWPYIGVFVKDMLIENVEKDIEDSLPSTLRPFRFEKIHLGDVSPRIGGIKVYTDNVRRDEIILDLELIYASDSNFKVSVRRMSAGLKDLSIRGNLRVIMKPLVSISPIIGAINIFFLNSPHIDFDLTNTANILDVPLLRNSLRGIVQDQIAAYMVLPNKIPLQLISGQDLKGLKYPLPAGVVRINVISARDLRKSDVGIFKRGKSDPYCKVVVGAQVFCTKVIKHTLQPSWNQYFEAVVDQQHGQFVVFEVKDKDPGEDDDIGNASIDISMVAELGHIDSWLPLENVNTGMLHVEVAWLYLSRDPKDIVQSRDTTRKLSTSKCQAGLLSTALLLLTCDSAKSLLYKKSMAEPSPYCKIRVGNQEKKTKPASRTTDPRWEQNFQFFVTDPVHQDINFAVLDAAKGSHQLGVKSYKLNLLLEMPDMTVDHSFYLQESAAAAQITFHACLLILTSKQPSDWQFSANFPNKSLNVHSESSNSSDQIPKSSVELKTEGLVDNSDITEGDSSLQAVRKEVKESTQDGLSDDSDVLPRQKKNAFSQCTCWPRK